MLCLSSQCANLRFSVQCYKILFLEQAPLLILFCLENEIKDGLGVWRLIMHLIEIKRCLLLMRTFYNTAIPILRGLVLQWMLLLIDRKITAPLLTIGHIRSKERSHHIKYGGDINFILEIWLDESWLQSTISILAMAILLINVLILSWFGEWSFLHSVLLCKTEYIRIAIDRKGNIEGWHGYTKTSNIALNNQWATT